MRRCKKRLLSLVLAFSLCLTLLPGAALAEDVDLSGMTEKFAEDTGEAVTWPIYQDMENWNLLVSDEGRKYFQDGGWDYMLYCSFYDSAFLHKDPYDTGVDIPRGATEVYADYYWMLEQYLDASFSGEKPSSWAQNQVDLAIDAGIVPQSLQSRYTSTATRADFCALVVALLEKYLEITLPAEETFSDTDDINVRKAATLGIVQGVGNGMFNPDGPLTREQAATMLERAYRASMGYLQGGGTSDFSDASSVSSWAADAVAKMETSGIMTGVGNNQFKPKDP